MCPLECRPRALTVMEPWWPVINKNNRCAAIMIVACTIAWIVNGKKVFNELIFINPFVKLNVISCNGERV